MEEIPMGKSIHKHIAAIIFCIFLLNAGICLGAETALQEPGLFEKAFDHYLAYEPDKAAELFDRFVREFPESPAHDAALFWKAKSLLVLKRADEARTVFADLSVRFPESHFAAFSRQELETLEYAPKEDKKVIKDDAELKSVKEKEEHDKEVKALRARLQDQEKRYGQAEAALKKAFEEKAERDVNLLEREALLDGIRSCKAEYEQLKADIRMQEEQRKASEAGSPSARMQRELNELRRANEALTKQGSEMRAELESLRSGLKDYSRPAVRIGESTYSVLQMMEENYSASGALSKIGAEPVPWRRCNTKEDFIIGQLLYLRAKAAGIKTEDAAELLAKKHFLDDRERAYLVKHLAVDELVRKEMAPPEVGEVELRGYYEVNRKDFLVHAEERIIETLSLNYRKEDEQQRASLASELQREAINGKSLENIYRFMPDMLEYGKGRLTDLPDLLRQRAEGLKDGEIIKFATENEFIIIQMHFQGPLYRPFEVVRDEIRNKIISWSSPEQKLESWLNEMRKEAVELK
ncbi:MAG: hypothetical protein HZA17_00095 [Nitrospirae bacterium]|nr:hypothetical protein [Nitrospirota bacterium]